MSRRTEDRCPVDLARYLGTWYEIARKPFRGRDRAQHHRHLRARGRRRGARDNTATLDAPRARWMAPKTRPKPVDAGNNAKLEGDVPAARLALDPVMGATTGSCA